MNWLYYIAEANIYLGVFYLAYCVFLAKETWYQLNRAYLISICVVSFALPVLQIGALRPVERMLVSTVNYNVPITIEPGVVSLPVTEPALVKPTAPVVAAVAAQQYHFSIKDLVRYAYILGAATLCFMLAIKLIMLFGLVSKAGVTKQQGYKLVQLPQLAVAFSFFNYLFIGAQAPGADIIIRHELVHIKQRHSADIIFLEIIKIISWFNPLVYLLQRSLKTVHEYIADERTAAYEADPVTYSSFLVDSAYGASGSSITHSFFNHNLLKKRIIMLDQKRSGSLARLKYLVALPICAALLCTSTLVFSKTYGWVDLDPAKGTAAANIPARKAAVKKILKITYNGSTGLTNKLYLNNKGKQVAYSVNTFTAKDKELLLKRDKIKVEIVDDSVKNGPVTADGHLLLPTVNYSGYPTLDHHLYKNIHYTPAPGEKGGMVSVNFTVDNDRKISDLKIKKSGGEKLDALVLSAFNSYKGIVNDDPGKTLTLGLYFFTDDYSIFKDRDDYDGGLIITNYPHKIELTSKGYEYDEWLSAGDNKVIMYEKNGDYKWYMRNTATAAEIQLLKDKYGYVFPSNAYLAIESVTPGKGYGKYMFSAMTVSSYLDDAYSKDLYEHIHKDLKYPEKERTEHTGGVVLLKFNVDQSGAVGNVKVARTGGTNFDEAAVNALSSFDGKVNDSAGEHTIAIVFCVAQNQYRPKVSESFKKAGYVGELARAENSPKVSIVINAK